MLTFPLSISPLGTPTLAQLNRLLHTILNHNFLFICLADHFQRSDFFRAVVGPIVVQDLELLLPLDQSVSYLFCDFNELQCFFGLVNLQQEVAGQGVDRNEVVLVPFYCVIQS